MLDAELTALLTLSCRYTKHRGIDTCSYDRRIIFGRHFFPKEWLELLTVCYIHHLLATVLSEFIGALRHASLSQSLDFFPLFASLVSRPGLYACSHLEFRGKETAQSSLSRCIGPWRKSSLLMFLNSSAHFPLSYLALRR